MKRFAGLGLLVLSMALAGCEGSLRVSVSPQAAIDVGAQWRVDNGDWQDSGAVAAGLTAGTHQVVFKVIPEWNTPAPIAKVIEAGKTAEADGDYTQATGEGEGEGELPPGAEAAFAGIDFVWCPPGTFMMGPYPGEQDSDEGEGPQHPVTLTQGFWLSKHEVTQAQWEAVMGSNPSWFTGDTNCPVDYLSWNMIAGSGGFLETLNAAHPGMAFRLPTEAEWEYACRAGTTTRFYWGDDPNYVLIDDYAWHWDNSGLTTHPVGEKLPNAWGVYDMSGNVWEWVQDWMEDYSADAVAVTDPAGPETGTYRVLRGGSWALNVVYCRSADRGGSYPGIVFINNGFRLCRADSSL